MSRPGGEDAAGRAASSALVSSLICGQPDESVFEAAHVMSEGREGRLYLFGARKVPLLALLARPVRQFAAMLGGEKGAMPRVPVDLAAEVSRRFVIAMATRESVPGRIRLLPMDESRIEALKAMTIQVDGDEFYLEPAESGGSGVMVRPLYATVPLVRCQEVGDTLGVEVTSWGDVGVLQVQAHLDPSADAWVYDTVAAARWGAEPLPALGAMIPGVVGCDRLLVSVMLFGGECRHPYRDEALRAGVVQPDQVLALLVVEPDLSGVEHLNGGAAANNALSSNAERVWDASVSPISHDSLVLAGKCLESYVGSVGSLEGLTPNLAGAFSLLVLNLECLTAQLWSGLVRREHAEHVGAWVLRSLATNDPESGSKIVSQVSSLRDQGHDLAIHGGITERGTYRVVINEVDATGKPISEGVLIPG